MTSVDSHSNVELIPLTKEEKQQMLLAKQHFGKALERITEIDTGVRDIDEADLSVEMKLNKINNELSKNLKNFQIVGLDNDKVNILFINNGIKHSLKITADFKDRKLEKLNAIVNGKLVSINQLTNIFKNSELLNAYIQNNKVNNFNTGIVASERNILERLANLTPDADNILNYWKKNYLKEIQSGLYSSKYSFEELLNKTNANLFTEEELNKITNAKKTFGMTLERIDESYTTFRELAFLAYLMALSFIK
jgi:hypothetical protein